MNHRWLMPAAIILLCLAIPSFVPSLMSAENLTLKRIFAAPNIAGPTPRNVKLAPDGTRVTFLRGKATNKDQLDLWEFNVKAGRPVCWSTPTGCSRSGWSCRTRRRRAASGSGSPASPASSNTTGRRPAGRSSSLWVGTSTSTTSRKKGEGAARRITTTDAFETDARFSPDGKLVSVRAGTGSVRVRSAQR